VGTRVRLTNYLIDSQLAHVRRKLDVVCWIKQGGPTAIFQYLGYVSKESVDAFGHFLIRTLVIQKGRLIRRCLR
jgi:hypothetical protein